MTLRELINQALNAGASLDDEVQLYVNRTLYEVGFAHGKKDGILLFDVKINKETN